MAQNEMALSFYSAGFFAPQNADAALACLDMMDFDRKNFVEQKIRQNGGVFQMLVQTQQLAIQLAQQLDTEHGTALAQQMAQQFQAMTMSGGAPSGAQMPPPEIPQVEGGESPVTKKARTRVAESTNPQ